MIRGLSVLGLIPARGGSKRLPGKHLLPLGDRPLIAWTIQAALASRYLDRVVLSSEDPAIIDLARIFGCDAPFVRPDHLATDEASSLAVVEHALAALPGYDILALLQPTSPLRTAQDIDAALERMIETGAPACVSVTRPAKSPYWCYRTGPDGRLIALFPDVTGRSQDLPETWALNGALYLIRCDYLKKTGTLIGDSCIAHPMPPERSVDIDTALDLRLAEVLLEDRQSAAP